MKILKVSSGIRDVLIDDQFTISFYQISGAGTLILNVEKEHWQIWNLDSQVYLTVECPEEKTKYTYRIEGFAHSQQMPMIRALQSYQTHPFFSQTTMDICKRMVENRQQCWKREQI